MGAVRDSSGQQPRQILDTARIEPQMGASLPLTGEFRDHSGHTVVLSELLGKRPIVLCLVYFDCPMLCKLAADGLVRTVASLPETVGQDFDVLLISFDPHDTPERADAARQLALKNYARSGADAGWHFLTGSQVEIDRVTSAVGFHYVWDDASKQFAHASGLIVVSPEGVITEYLDGVQFSPRALISAVHRAGNNEVFTQSPTSFVRCYLYDPTTGKFGATVQWTIRAMGLLTVLALATLIVRLYHGEKLQSTKESNAS
ncbi:SCO family protein [Novipirellula rosea]|uniref:SCO family protein n=2 Tax=Novipirellula rosea TaxID=1031540 RepID=A0ABP8NLT8_9BACT